MSGTIDWSKYSEVLFMDSMVALEAKPLASLPWTEIDPAGPILVLVVPQVMKEIDKRKRDGRLGKRAREFNRLIAPAAESGSAVQISAGPPQVDIAFAQIGRIDWDALQDLDPEEGDARVVAQMLNVANVPAAVKTLFSYDNNPIAMASRYGIKARKLPENWLLEPEPSPHEKELLRLKSKVAELETTEPEIELKLEFEAPDSLQIYRVEALDASEQSGRLQADQVISEISYNANDPSYEIDDPHQFLLGRHLEKELLLQYEKGIVSLAERANCPLMWSHYGDQHHGVCIGYSVPADVYDDLHKVKYGGKRLVDASKVLAMLEGDKDARRQVNEAVLLRKAASWRYEQEWRLIGQRGLRDSPLELEEVIFGMRCKEAVKYAVITALDDRRRPVRFYEMHEIHGTFNLKKLPVEDGEMRAFFPRRSRDIHEAFQSIAAAHVKRQSP